jgi:ATP-dependent Clp protease ATP-binding subunit ClpA
MPEIKPGDLFGCLNRLGYRALDGAATFCKLRGNPQVELVHWVHQVIHETDSDLHCIVRHFEIDPARLSSQLTVTLDRLPRGASAISGFGPSIREGIEQGWVYASLMFKQAKIRTGHVVIGLLKNPGLANFLYGMADEFRKIREEALVDSFDHITAGSPEEAMMETAGAGAVPGETSGAIAPDQKKGSLAQYSVDLTEKARNGEIDPILGRDEEIRQIVDILMRRRQNNPILTGEAGVGKTAVVEGFAQRIADGDVPPALRDVTLRTLDLGLLQAGASMKGEFENRLKNVIEEVQSSPKPVILFIDEAHTLIGAGGQAGQGDAANLLKPALARGTLRTIAATTWAEYKKYFEKDPALTRRFQVIKVGEPDVEKAVRMIRGLAPILEKHHKVSVLDSALSGAARLSSRYIPSRQLPDKAVSLIDTACARVAISQHATPAEVEDSTRLIEVLETETGILEREQAVGLDHRKRLGEIRSQIETETTRLDGLKTRWLKEKELVTRILDLRREAQQALNPEGSEDSPKETAEAETLDQLMARTGSLPVPEAFRLIRQAAAALDSLHREGQIHRDLKPASILLTSGRVTLAQPVDPGDHENAWTPAFASPEQVREEELDARSDIFSLGVTLWSLLEGRPAFAGSISRLVADRLSSGEYEALLPPGLTGAFRSALARMVSKNPEARHPTGGDLLVELDLCLTSLETTDGDDSAAPGTADSPQLREARQLEAELAALQGEHPLVFPHVDEQAVASVIADWTGIPAGRMIKNEIEQTLNLASILRRRVIGQDHALELIARRIQTSRARLDNPNRPIGVFMLAGPSGTGKTETALTLAETLFGDETSLISINMSEFQEAHTVSTLKGAPPGYVGYGEGGRLTEAVRRRPYAVILLDEVEKAHPDVHEIFFQVFDKGWMEDGEGRAIDFKNTLIILTSNASQDIITTLCKDPELMPEPDALEKAMRGPLTKVFPDALLNRLVVIPYYPISAEMLRTIIELNLRKVRKRILENHGIPFTWDESATDLIARRCTELERGARMVDALITNTLLPEIGKVLLSGLMEGQPLEKVYITSENGEFVFKF